MVEFHVLFPFFFWKKSWLDLPRSTSRWRVRWDYCFFNFLIRNYFLVREDPCKDCTFVSLEQWFLIFLKSGNTFDYMKNSPKLTIQKTNKNIPRRSKYILENILLNIFKFYILKYIIKFLQSHDNNKKKKIGFHNFAKHLQKARLNTGPITKT